MTRPITFPRKSPKPWPKISSSLFLGLLLVACGSAAAVTTSTANPVITTTTAPETRQSPTTTLRIAFDRGELTDFEPVEIDLGGTLHWVALADTDAERAKGLMNIGDVGDFTGMLFTWEEEVSAGFWMKGTVMPLDLYFYSAQGALVDQVSLVPCSADPCPVHTPETPFQWVLETPAGNLAPPIEPLTIPA
ncbi:MAG: DUF192 domain-containing protein [Acidimicrobiia bacterium]